MAFEKVEVVETQLDHDGTANDVGIGKYLFGQTSISDPLCKFAVVEKERGVVVVGIDGRGVEHSRIALHLLEQFGLRRDAFLGAGTMTPTQCGFDSVSCSCDKEFGRDRPDSPEEQTKLLQLIRAGIEKAYR